MKMKEDSENIGLKLNIQKTKIMASGPITSWQIDGETVETWHQVGGMMVRLMATWGKAHGCGNPLHTLPVVLPG